MNPVIVFIGRRRGMVGGSEFKRGDRSGARVIFRGKFLRHPCPQKNVHFPVHSFTSVPASLSCGVSQGSVLVPILFVVYTTSYDTSAVIEHHSILHHSCADDSQQV